MPVGIKGSASTTPSGSLRKGSVAIGIGDVGPTSTTGFYSMPDPVSGKYIVSLANTLGASNPIFYSPQDITELTNLARMRGATGANTGSEADILAWIASQPALMAANFQYESIVTNGLILNLDAGFVGSYPTTGTTWYDLSGNAYNGTLTNGPTFNSANSGSIVFDGVDDQVPVSNATFNSTLDSLSAITVQTWIKPPTSPTQYGGYISRQTSAVSNYTGFSIRQNNLNNGAIEWFGFGSNVNMITGSVTPNAWTLATGTWNGTVMTLYINGSQASTRTNSTNIMSASGQTFTIGKLSYGNFPQTFTMASVQIYNRALTAAEVLQNYNAQKSRFGL